MTPQPHDLCPFCGIDAPGGKRCRACGGLLDDASIETSIAQMGLWFVRREHAPHLPGCSYETLVRMIDRGKVGAHTILRGPETDQLWVRARDAKGIAHFFGVCWSCGTTVAESTRACRECGNAILQQDVELETLSVRSTTRTRSRWPGAIIAILAAGIGFLIGWQIRPTASPIIASEPQPTPNETPVLPPAGLDVATDPVPASQPVEVPREDSTGALVDNGVIIYLEPVVLDRLNRLQQAF